MIITEDMQHAELLSKLLLGFGVEHILDGSYIVIANFEKQGKQRYFASGESIEDVLAKVEKYKAQPNFDGKIYKIQSPRGILILCDGESNVKYWKKEER